MNTLAPSSRQHSHAGGMLLEIHDPHCVTASAIEARALPPISLCLIRALPGKTFQGRNLALVLTTHTARLFTGYPTYSCFRQDIVAELARLFEAYATELPIKTFSIKAAMTMPTLLLQKPHAKSKTRDHITCLKRRLELWEKGDLAKLLKEGKSIQNHLRVFLTRDDSLSDDRIARTFSKLMMEGKVRAALRLLVKDGRTGFLKLDQVIGAAEGSTGRSLRKSLKRNTLMPTKPMGMLS